MEDQQACVGKRGWGLSKRQGRGGTVVLTLWGLLVLGWAAVAVAQSIGVPACASSFGDRVVLNATTLDAMIAQAEPGGARPDRAQAQVLIVIRHYLAQHQGLLVIPRQVTDQALVVAQQQDCLPYPESAAHVRVPFDALTAAERQTLLAYYDAVQGGTPTPVAPAATTQAGEMVRVPGGMVRLEDGNTVTVEAFALERQIVTNAAYRAFIDAQGYMTETYWTAEGWLWRQEKGRTHPSYWDNTQVSAPDKPVAGVTWYEAAAYCQWAGKALPTEGQWSKACQLAAEQPGSIGDLDKGLLEWTSTRHDARGMSLRSDTSVARDRQPACGAHHVLFPGVTANFIGFRCQTPMP